LASLFHKDIRYQEHSDNLIIGIDALIAYWNRNSKKQTDVIFTPSRVFSAQTEIVVHWDAKFFELKKKELIFLEGIMWLTLEGGLIINLIEFFERKQHEPERKI